MSENLLTITNEANGSSLILHLEGRLDTVTSKDLEKVVQNLPDEVTELKIDVEKVLYIASAGLRVMLLSSHIMGEKGGSFAVINATDSIHETFEATGLLGLVSVE